MVTFAFRLAVTVAFLPLALLWGVCVFFQMLAAGVLFLVRGPDSACTDRLVLGPPGTWAARPLDYLIKRAGFDS